MMTSTFEQRMYTMTPNWKPFLASVGELLNCIPIFEEVRETDEPDRRIAQSYDALHVLYIIYSIQCFDLMGRPLLAGVFSG